jgi:hypothetical protein
MSNLVDWLTLPMAAERWGITRGRVWKSVTDRLAEEDGAISEVVQKAGDRFLLHPDFVDAVKAKIDGDGRYKVDAAINAVLSEMSEESVNG